MGALACSANAQPSSVERGHAAQMQEGLKLFKSSVRTILTDHCIECHGRDEIEGEFDMSTRESLLASGLVAVSAEDSDLVDSIRHRFEPYMPHKRDKLDDESIAAIVRWIDLGAPYDRPLADSSSIETDGPLVVTDEDRDYWAYRPLGRPSVPMNRRDRWSLNEIDRFVYEAQLERGIEPNPRANGRALIRRAYLNTLGLPPTEEDVAAFVNDLQPGAYERMVERLLESPHYGERWARHWMDIARFAESTGFEIDFDRPYAYHYRDFLIQAFNENMPYDQFVSWQVAGDELMPHEPLALMATGFLGAGPHPSVLTEKEFESARYDELDDMVNTMGTALLGTTIGCARCHDHKYDPIPQKDYYQLAAHFTRTVRSYVDYDPGRPDYESALMAWKVNDRVLEKRLKSFEEAELDRSFQAWLEARQFEIPLERWLVMDPLEYSSVQGATIEKQWDRSLLLSGLNPEQENETLLLECETELLDIQGLRMETLTHPSLPNQGPGRDHEGGFTVNEISVHIQKADTGGDQWTPVGLASAEATTQENDESWSAGAAINGVTQGWSIDLDAFGKDQAIVLRFKEPVGFGEGTRFRIRVSSGFNIQQMVGRPRFSVTLDPRAPVEVSEGIPVRAYQALIKLLVGLESEKLTLAERNGLREWYGRNHPEWNALRDEWKQHQWDRPISDGTRIMVSGNSLPPAWHRSANKGYPSFYEETHLLPRGDVDQKGEAVGPGVLQILNPTGVSGTALSRPRSALVAWLTDTERGAGALLARVFVNRVWYYHFGRGLVATPSDFGKQGEDPSHPELLEWLANDFVTHGWDVKRLQKQILVSATYRQNSNAHPDRTDLDVDNKYLWRFSPRRAEAEVIRDSMLQVSGLLDPTPFGPGTRDTAMDRRSIYFFVKRGALIPEMLLFDWPEHLVGIGKRASTTVAPQALQFLNGPQTRRYARAFADRLSRYPSDQSKIRAAYQLAFSRFPSKEETAVALQFIETQGTSYLNNGYDAHQAWTDYCQSLLSTNEFLYIR